MNKNKKIYIAGSLFSEAEVAQRIKEGELLKKVGFEYIYNPIQAPCNSKEDLPTAEDIFWGDTKEVLESEIVVIDISNPLDAGVFCETGIAWACNYIHRLANEGKNLDEVLNIMKEKMVVAHLSDIRKSTSHRYNGNHIPVGFNQFAVACIEDVGVIKDSFNEVLEELND
ncbi:nucleoside 2-deoxyribosyltransferase [Clostridium sp.]|uniref:nucleoside 2-deoxyribosyltransferase n=1 Tax=Clostridium sp. TaxID=1506 RepID=UPI001D6D7EA9|nr:nucleoside 2-deoxyribosyltransferase [Clostridium sp.]MBS5307817.1 nucleoside 2-deoxyribosyltransferase [Clostridium sp.]